MYRKLPIQSILLHSISVLQREPISCSLTETLSWFHCVWERRQSRQVMPWKYLQALLWRRIMRIRNERLYWLLHNLVTEVLRRCCIFNGLGLLGMSRRDLALIILMEAKSPDYSRPSFDQHKTSKTLHVVDIVVLSEVLVQRLPLFVWEVDLLEVAEISKLVKICHVETSFA